MDYPVSDLEVAAVVALLRELSDDDPAAHETMKREMARIRDNCRLGHAREGLLWVTHRILANDSPKGLFAMGKEAAYSEIRDFFEEKLRE